MTETEVLEKLEIFKKAIIELKNKLDEKEDVIEALNISIEGANKTVSQYIDMLHEAEDKYDDLKQKTYLTIKHLVEDVIEKQEKDLEFYQQECINSSKVLKETLDEKTVTNEKIEILEEQKQELESKLEDNSKEILELKKENAALQLKLSVIPKEGNANEKIKLLNNKLEEARRNALTMEEEFNKQREKAINLEIANRQLENLVASKNIKETDETNKLVVKTAERELKEMLN